MEGVGARFGRSSTRYGQTSTVFSGPVRKWKKKWVHVSPPSDNNNNHHNHQISNQNGTRSNTSNGNNGSSHLLLYKWAPITQSQNGNNNNSNGRIGDQSSAKDDDVEAVEEPPRRKFRYIPVALLEEQQNEVAEVEEAEQQVEDEEAKPSNAIAEDATEPTSKGDGLDEKPDVNDVPMEENQAPNDSIPITRQDLNVSTLDLGLNLNDGDPESDNYADEK